MLCDATQAANLIPGAVLLTLLFLVLLGTFLLPNWPSQRQPNEPEDS